VGPSAARGGTPYPGRRGDCRCPRTACPLEADNHAGGVVIARSSPRIARAVRG
jgi:hypothetical protein